jgi:hypothetical protein
MYTVIYTFTKSDNSVTFSEINDEIDNFILENFGGKCTINHQLLEDHSQLSITHQWRNKQDYLAFTKNSIILNKLKQRRTHNSTHKINSSTTFV